MLRDKTGLMGVLCVLLVILVAPVSLGVTAADGPPDISALAGTWQVSYSGIRGLLNSGEVIRHKEAGTWQISVYSDSVVQITGFADGPGDITYYATYAHDLLFLGTFADGVPYAHSGYLIIKGKPGKLTFQGEIIAVGAGSWARLHADTIKGKQTSTIASPIPAAKPAAVVAGAKPPPTPPLLADLYETDWVVKVGGKGYNFADDRKFPVKQTLQWHMTQGAEDGDVDVESFDGEETETLHMQYFNGLLIYADGNGTDPATNAQCAYVKVTGKPGAMKLSGKFLGYEIGGSDDDVESDKLNGKQVVSF